MVLWEKLGTTEVRQEDVSKMKNRNDEVKIFEGKKSNQKDRAKITEKGRTKINNGNAHETEQ